MEKVISILEIPDLNEATISEAKKKFLNYKQEGIITEGSFSDDKWCLTDEMKHVTLVFSINTIKANSLLESLGITEDEFKVYLKTFIIYRIGDLILTTLQTLVNDIMTVIEDNNGRTILHPMEVSDFYTMLPVKADDIISNIAESMDEESYKIEKSGVRKLAAFDSYFKFNDIVDKFLTDCTDENEKLFYYPIILWWKISAILPTRPKEFVVTPRHCLSRTDKGNFLTLMKDKLKGKDRTVSYKIKLDFDQVTYQIPDDLADIIEWYISKTKSLDLPNTGTLFTLDSHYKKWQKSAGSNSWYYTYSNLATCLRYFYDEVVSGKYGYKIVYDRENLALQDNEIDFIHLGDARHLALINIIAEGGTPIVAMALAGQDSAEVSAGYYSNITNMIECKVYRQYKKVTDSKAQYSLSNVFNSALTVSKFSVLTGEYKGRCYSAKAVDNDFSDCEKVAGPDGQIGFCPNCPYYRAENGSFYHSADIYKHSLEIECKNLANIVKAVRNGHGDEEDIKQVILKLQHAKYSYEQYLKVSMKGNDYGKTESNN